MTNTAITTTTTTSLKLDDAIEQVLVQGDLRKLTAPQRVEFYHRVCSSIGLNPLTRPFEYMDLSGKLTLYARRDCADQLRRIYGVSITIVSRTFDEGLYIVTARATMPNGRTDESTGVVDLEGLKGEKRANSLLRAETKAKRRVTLSIVGLGILDETEVASVSEARTVRVNEQTGEILDSPKAQEPAGPSAAESAAACANFRVGIDASKTTSELEEVGKAIGAAFKSGVLTRDDRNRLGEAYAAKKTALMQAAAPSKPAVADGEIEAAQ
jgi:hypothetical protein